MMIWRVIVLVVAIQLTGCVSVSRSRTLQRQVTELRSMVGVQQADLSKKDEEIVSLRKLISDQDAALQDRGKKVEELKKKLEGFGVY